MTMLISIYMFLSFFHCAGDLPYSATAFSLTIDKEIVVAAINNQMSALCWWFTAFYVFNYEYPEKLGATLEFIQR